MSPTNLPPPLPDKSTIIFDYRDAPLDPDELAAIQAMKELRRRTSLKTRRRPIRQPSTTANPANLDAPDPDPFFHEVHPAPQSHSEPVEPKRPKGRLDPNTLDAPRDAQRSRGAQPNNTNALKYGFYSRRIPQRELDGLEDTAVTSLKDEIDVMRIFSRKVAELGSDVNDLEEATSLLRVLSLATSSINRLVRTHTRIPDPELDPAWLLRTALLELEEEWPELKAFGDQYRNKPRAASSNDDSNH